MNLYIESKGQEETTLPVNNAELAPREDPDLNLGPRQSSWACSDSGTYCPSIPGHSVLEQQYVPLSEGNLIFRIPRFWSLYPLPCTVCGDLGIPRAVAEQFLQVCGLPGSSNY